MAPATLVVVEEVRRQDDDELCGHVEQRDGRWCALTVFGALLGTHGTREDAWDEVLRDGLASLGERWMLRHDASGEEEVVCIVEARPGAVTVARGYYAVVDTPTLTITHEQLAAGEWELHR